MRRVTVTIRVSFYCTYLFAVIVIYLKSIEIILLLIAVFIAITPDKKK